jgi:hypothetical protein
VEADAATTKWRERREEISAVWERGSSARGKL